LDIESFSGYFSTIYILGKLYISTFVLFFLISEKTYKEISQHKQDKTYVRTSAVEKAMQFLHEHGVVILY
jgi:hypothetical protein